MTDGGFLTKEFAIFDPRSAILNFSEVFLSTLVLIVAEDGSGAIIIAGRQCGSTNAFASGRCA